MIKEAIIKKFLKVYDEFYRSGERNRHIEILPIRIYTRKSLRVFHSRKIQCLDIGSVNIESEYQKMGLCTDLLKALVDAYPNENFFIESIVNENMRKVGDRCGFVLQYPDADFQTGYDMYLIR